jgi:Rrf2 family iron-sulfur cluster assembly transcriptional regulator
MKLSTKGRYAVMAVVDLACNCDAGPVALSDIASRQDISLSYLEQLFAKLRRSEVVKSIRGPGGGYLLARAANDTRISEIITAVDEPIATTRCGITVDSGGATNAKGCLKDNQKCLTHDLWAELGRQIQLYLNSVTVSDVVERRVFGTAGLFDLHHEAVKPADVFQTTAAQ